MEIESVTAADIRAELARLNVPRYLIAARAGIHPSRLSAVLSERDHLSKTLAAALLDAIDEERAARSEVTPTTEDNLL